MLEQERNKPTYGYTTGAPRATSTRSPYLPHGQKSIPVSKYLSGGTQSTKATFPWLGHTVNSYSVSHWPSPRLPYSRWQPHSNHPASLSKDRGTICSCQPCRTGMSLFGGADSSIFSSPWPTLSLQDALYRPDVQYYASLHAPNGSNMDFSNARQHSFADHLSRLYHRTTCKHLSSFPVSVLLTLWTCRLR